MRHNWTASKLSELDTKKLKNVRTNAADNAVLDLMALCDQELSSRKAVRPNIKRAIRPHKNGGLDAEASALMAQLVNDLQIQFDLSEETAKSLSVGIKGFRPHRLLMSTGQAKIGGTRKAGAAAIDRYVSYRIGENLAKLCFFLAKNAPIDHARWIVAGSPGLIDGAMPIAGQFPAGELPEGVYDKDIGLVFQAFDDAKPVFEAMLHKIAPAR